MLAKLRVMPIIKRGRLVNGKLYSDSLVGGKDLIWIFDINNSHHF